MTKIHEPGKKKLITMTPGSILPVPEQLPLPHTSGQMNCILIKLGT